MTDYGGRMHDDDDGEKQGYVGWKRVFTMVERKSIGEKDRKGQKALLFSNDQTRGFKKFVHCHREW